MSFAIAFAVGLIATPIAIRLARITGLVDRPAVAAVAVGARVPLKIHSAPVPVLGGAVVCLAALIGAAVAGSRPPLALAASCGLALAVGTADDARGLPPWIRVVALGACGAVLAAGEVRMWDGGIGGAVGVAALVVACANAVNLVDGQDGLAGGLAGVAALGLASLAAPTAGSVALALAGALLAFLVWNLPPAKVFLGNGGAYGVGVLLAASAAAVSTSGARGTVAAALCLGVFAAELCLTVARRARSRRPVTEGDREHTYDRLARRLGARGASTAVMVAIGAALALGAWAVGPRP
jgi:UDP-GlcNAc:undecaprenyl-phosphate GlcNAc-1-phosphate transferase